MSDEDQLIELCEVMSLSLDINYLKGTVTVARRRYHSVGEALSAVRRRSHNLVT
jgi:hypothetical protein